MRIERKCSIEGCNRKYRCLSFCQMHYTRFKRGETNMSLETFKPGKKRGICKIEGCGRPHAVKGYCVKHFMTYKRRGLIEGYPICSIINCNRTEYAKGLCLNHYRTGGIEHKKPKFYKCQVDGCQNKGPYSLGYCGHHYQRYRSGIPFNAGPHETFKGGGNPRWNGGISEYPNHSLMKKLRLKVLGKANYICAECGGIADRIHHRDGSTDNHFEENFEPICAKCHCKFSVRYKKHYGFTKKELKEMGFLEDIQLMQKNLNNEGYQPIENLMAF